MYRKDDDNHEDVIHEIVLELQQGSRFHDRGRDNSIQNPDLILTL